MADTQTSVTTLDIQLLDANRKNATTIKLDNPRSNVTREMVSTVMQPALANEWFLAQDGSIAVYLGDITVNQSIKTKLGGEDFYLTPSSITIIAPIDEIGTATITCTGAVIQGINIDNITAHEGWDEHPEGYIEILAPVIAANGLSAQIRVKGISNTGGEAVDFDVNVIVQGTVTTIPASVTTG